jgi:TonB family protein
MKHLKIVLLVGLVCWFAIFASRLTTSRPHSSSQAIQQSDTESEQNSMFPCPDSRIEPIEQNTIQPEYPDSAKKYRIDGKVVVQVLVDTSGYVKSYSFKKVEPEGAGFEIEVAKVITSWRFRPATRHCRKYEDWTTIPIRFRLKQ